MGLYKRGAAKELPIVDFAPDQPWDTPGILLDCQGAMPTIQGYQAMNSALPHVYGALPELPTGSAVATYSDKTPQHWAGGTAHLWRMSGMMDDPASTWVQADTQGPVPFNAAKWRFAQFGDDLIAVGGNSVLPQVANGAGGTFATLGGNPPVGATLVVSVNSQVMMFLGDTWYVSAIGSDNSWNASTQTQAGNAPITDLPGDVIAAQPLYRNVVAFKNVGIWLGSYVGGASIWGFQFISSNNGTWCQEATMAIPEGVAFFGLDDFYVTTGYTPQRIPNNLKEWFFDTADPAFFPSMTSRYDVYHAIGYWHFVSKVAPAAGVPDQYIAYNFRAGRWANGYLQTTCVPIPNFHFGDPTDINGFYFDTDNVLQTFRGPPGPMRLLTGYLGMPRKLSQLLGVRPKYSLYPASQTLQAFHVRDIGQQDVAGPAGVMGKGGWFYLRQTDRYHRVQLATVGNATQPIGENIQVGPEVSAFAYEWRESGDR